MRSNLYKLAGKFKLRCPYCFRVLKIGEKKSYELGWEHALNPNAEHYPLRDTLTCSCELGKCGYWSTWEGGFYALSDWKTLKVIRGRMQSNFDAVFSFDWFSHIDSKINWFIYDVKKFLKFNKK